MTTTGPRARYREQTRTEIKAVALGQLAEGGIPAIALTRIAKELELSGPALYRYFANRDGLLGALIGDAYQALAEAVGEAAEVSAQYTPRQRLRSLAGACRAWAVRQPHRFLLIAGSPLPGYTAPPETLGQARSALGPFLPLFASARPSPAVLPVVEQMTAWERRDPAVAAWVTEYVDASDRTRHAGGALAGAVMAWTRIHGAVGLEVNGQFNDMGHDPQTLLDAEMDALADSFGLTRPVTRRAESWPPD